MIRLFNMRASVGGFRTGLVCIPGLRIKAPRAAPVDAAGAKKEAAV